MLFNSLEFAVFFPAVVLLYLLIPRKLRCPWLLVASYFFYMGWNPKYAVLILASTIITWLSGILMGRVPENRKKLVVAGSFFLNLSILVLFKYFDFLLHNLNTILQSLHLTVVDKPFDVLLPVGISFYTFQALSYTVDVYRGEIEPEKNLMRYALFVSFFPQLVAGPIERSGNLLTQIQELPKKKLWNYERVTGGLILMIWGLFLKMVIADRAAVLVDQIFDNYQIYGFFGLSVGAVTFALQIYCDFASYSTIAIGAAQVMNFQLIENFNTPYFAKSIPDFWRRWHISLSSWFRDYLYVPLGGSRCSKLCRYRNILITFLVSGLWHGANWTYVVWGGIHGLYQVIGYELRGVKEWLNQKFHTKTDCISYKLGQVCTTFLLTDLAWIFFRSNTLGDAFYYLERMFTKPDFWCFFNGEIYSLGLERQEIHILLLGLLLLFLTDLIQYFRKERLDVFLAEQNLWFRWGVLLCLIGAIAIFGVYGPAYDAKQFIYFQF
ncbi:MAG: MBOAT family protein [Lachnospiraceae bacterium]|nr:MBOAT family protein [Lachnospiraceae bacterium]